MRRYVNSRHRQISSLRQFLDDLIQLVVRSDFLRAHRHQHSANVGMFDDRPRGLVEPNRLALDAITRVGNGSLIGALGNAHTRSVRADQLPRARTVGGEPGRSREQPQRRRRVGPVPDPVRPARPRRRPHRGARRPVSGCLGPRAARHRRAVRPGGQEAAHRQRDARTGHRDLDRRRRDDVHHVGAGRRAPRSGYGHGVPGPARRHRRRRPPCLARVGRRRLQAVA